MSWLKAVKDGYEFEGKRIEPSNRLQELLERDEIRELQQQDGSYILGHIEDEDLFDEIHEEIKKSIVSEVDFNDLQDIETVKYRWTCPVCGKEVEGSTEGQAKSHAKQHYYSRHY